MNRADKHVSPPILLVSPSDRERRRVNIPASFLEPDDPERIDAWFFERSGGELWCRFTTACQCGGPSEDDVQVGVSYRAVAAPREGEETIEVELDEQPFPWS